MAERPAEVKFDWRHALLLALTLIPVVLIFTLVEPIAQPLAYHDFADQRTLLGVPNFFDVTSNLVFLATGIAGILVCLSANADSSRHAWLVMFAGIALVSAGSAYYHWAPTNASLTWDRLAMSIGFMGLFTALLIEYVSESLGRLLLPLVILGAGGVIYWHFVDDLRWYACVQFIPLLIVPVVIGLFSGSHSHQWLLVVGLGWYILAKVAEHLDHEIFNVTAEFISGHTVKHLLAAVGCFCLVLMLKIRQRKENPK